MRALIRGLRVVLLSGFLATILVAALSAIEGQQQSSPAVRPLVDKTHRRMQPEDALTFAGTTLNVAGDPSKPGMYVIRRRFRPGETSDPHYHDQDRYVTVIKGTWWTDEGDVKRPDKMVPIKPGGFMLHPAGLHHYDGAKNEEVIVQIIGMGPVKTVEIDPQGRAIQTR